VSSSRRQAKRILGRMIFLPPSSWPSQAATKPSEFLRIPRFTLDTPTRTHGSDVNRAIRSRFALAVVIKRIQETTITRDR